MISVIVPVLNAARYLPLAIEALQGQDISATEYELLFVDNGSTDDSVAIIKKYPRVRLLHEPRRGSYAARNRAALEARGDILAFTDADCVVNNRWVRAIQEEFAVCRAQMLLGKFGPIRDSRLGALLIEYENEKAAYVCRLGNSRQQFAYAGNMAVRRAAWERYGPFVELQRGGDVVFVRRVVDGESFGCVRFCENMLVHHLELRSCIDYFRKMFVYGSSIRTYSRVVPAHPLASDDRMRILLRCALKHRYGAWRAMQLGVGLLIGFAAYEAGRLLNREETGQLPRAPDALPPLHVKETPTSLSIVVEWENVLLAGEERGKGALRRLAREVEAMSRERRIEVIVVFFPAEVDGHTLEQLVTAVFPPGMTKLLAANTGGYYEMKNAGAEVAIGDIVVFADSDTHAEEGWLRQLIQPFANPLIAAVAGNSYIEPTTFLGKAFATFWFFPPRTRRTRLEPAKGFAANNFAVRREIFRQLPFRSIPGTNRGAGEPWLERMMEANFTMVENPLAKMAHPPPNGGSHFFVCALTHGRDALLVARNQGRRLESGPFGTLLRFALNCARTTTRTWTRRLEVGLRPWEMIPVLLTGYVYYSVYFAGEVLTFLHPEWMSRRFRI